ncbi:MAG: hypothetical protein V5786_09575 [Psychromonas sp.]
MNKINFILIAIILSLAVGCRSNQDKVYKSTPNVKILKNGIIKYNGYINFAGYKLLLKAYAQSSVAPTLLIIKSRGGDPYAGMMMGRFIRDKKMRLRVRGYCLSACANYLFPAATVKYIENNAIVGFHQSLSGIVIEGKTIPIDEVLPLWDKIFSDMWDKIIVENHRKKDKKIALDKITQTPIARQRSQYYPEYISRCGKRKPNLDHHRTKNEILQFMAKKLMSCFNYMDEQESVFYNELKVDFRLSKMGIARLKKAQIESDNNVKFFYYDPASLKALGVQEVKYAKGWSPRENKYYKKMIKINLSDWQQQL